MNQTPSHDRRTLDGSVCDRARSTVPCRRRDRHPRKAIRSARSDSSCRSGPAAGVDITARLLADNLSTRWGKPVVVENRPGGDGLVAINAFISANDDHTLLFVPASTYHGASLYARKAAL